MKKFIIAFILGSLFGSAALGFAKEILVDFGNDSLPVLNEELRRMNRIITDHENRIYALEHP